MMRRLVSVLAGLVLACGCLAAGDEPVGDWPTNGAELNAWYSVPEEDDPTQGLLSVFEKIWPPFGSEDWDRWRDELPNYLEPDGRPLEADVRKLLEVYLKENAGVLAGLKGLGEPRPARYPLDFEGDRGILGTLLPHLTEVRMAGRICSRDAILAAEAGDGERVVDDLRGMMVLAKSLEREPLALSQLVLISVDSLARGCIESTQSRMRLSPEELREARRLFGVLDRERIFTTAMVGCMASTEEWLALESEAMEQLLLERSDASAMTEAVAQRTRRDWAAFKKRHPDFKAWLNHRFDAFRPRLSRLLVETSDMHQLAIENPVDRFVDQQRLDPVDQEMLLDLYYIASEGLSAADVVYRACQSNRAMGRVRDTVLAAYLYQHEHGALPERLGDLVPEYLDSLPEDPFLRGEPLKLKQTAWGIAVYSVGPNLEDDGGERDEEAFWDKDLVMWGFEEVGVQLGVE